MCQRITCKACGRPSFRGCGRHVAAVLGDVPLAERCQCGSASAKGSEMGLLRWMASLFRPADDRRGGR